MSTHNASSTDWFLPGEPMAADPVSHYSADSHQTTRLTTGDVNNDGYPDIAAAHGFRKAGLYINEDGRSFAAEHIFSEEWWDVGQNIGATSIALGDLDLDGNLDLVIPLYGDHYAGHMVQLYRGLGDGAFDLWPVDGYNALQGREGINQDGVDDGIILAGGAANPMFPGIADFNGDGRPDVVVSGNNGSWSVDVLVQSADGQFAVADSDRAGQNPQFFDIADFNEDGYPDVVVGAFYSGVLVFLNDADGNGALHQTGGTYLSPYHHYVVAADFNGDGHQDIAARGHQDAKVFVLYGDGAGGFPSSTSFSTSGMDGFLATADINQDGSTDLVVASSSTQSVDLLLNDGTGQFAVPVSTALDSAPWGIAVDDFDQDGWMDVAVARADDTVQVLWNQGGVAVTPDTFPVAENSPAATRIGTVLTSGEAPLALAITAGNTDPDGDGQAAFAIDAATGAIRVNDSGDLDYETTQRFNLQVTATDTGGHTDSAVVTVVLANVDEPGNERPETQDVAFSAPENSPVGALVGIVTAIDVDVDAGDTLAYAITEGNADPNDNGQAAFAIDADTGAITINDSGDLDFETTPRFNLTVQAADSGGLFATATASISLTDIDDPVQWRVSQGGNGHLYQAILVPEGITWDAAKVAAEAAGGHLATITSSAENEFIFALCADDPKFWNLSDRGPLLGGIQPPGSPEPRGNWQWVTGEDFSFTDWAGGEPNNCCGDDALQYHTRNSPIWNDIPNDWLVSGYILEIENIPYLFSTDENSANGTAIGAIDMAGWIDPAFSIMAGNIDTDGNGQAAFAIDAATGTITVNDSGDLDYETTVGFDLGVTIADVGGLSYTAAVRIDLTNVEEPGNDRPEAQNAAFSLSENRPAGTLVGAVLGTDLDAGDTLTYALTAGNADPNGNGQAAFAIDALTGVLTVHDGGDLDYETTTGFDLGVTVTDTGGLAATAAITVPIIDIFERRGTPGDDDLAGTAGDDLLDGLAGDDTLRGGAGDDSLIGGAGIDHVMETGDGNFTLTDTQLTGAGNDTLSGIDRASLTGGPGNDTLDASAFTRGAVVLDGGPGDDLLIGPREAGTWHQFNSRYYVNRFTGGAGDDTFTGGSGIDAIEEQGDLDFTLTAHRLTGLGTDSFTSMEVARLTGGAGDNRLDASGFSGSLTLLDGGAGNDFLVGGLACDLVLAKGDVDFTLSDTQLSGLGIDSLNGMDAAWLTGGRRDETLDVSAFSGTMAVLNGGAGDDTLIGRTGLTDRVIGHDDADFTLTDSRLIGQGADALTNIDQGVLIGGPGNNTLDTSAFTGQLAVLEGRGGDDTLIGRADGIDLVRAHGNVDFTLTDTQLSGLGTDTLTEIDEARLIGDGGDNTLDASAFTRGAVALYGEGGNDRLIGGSGNDRLDGGVGDDHLIGGTGTDRVTGHGDCDFILTATQLMGLGRDTLDGIEEGQLCGGPGDNRLDTSGFTGSLVILEGQGGDDTLIGRAGATDRVLAAGDVNFILSDTQLTGLGSDTLADIDEARFIGYSGSNAFDAAAFTRGPVRISGGSGDDTLLGGSGDDRLSGDYGDDLLNGGDGHDTLTGGDGADGFRFVTAGEGEDRITDFVSGEDRIEVVSANFGGLPVGALPPSRLVAADAPLQTGEAVFLYDATRGALAFDADGNGAGAATTIALLPRSGALQASDIQVMAA